MSNDDDQKNSDTEQELSEDAVENLTEDENEDDDPLVSDDAFEERDY